MLVPVTMIHWILLFVRGFGNRVLPGIVLCWGAMLSTVHGADGTVVFLSVPTAAAVWPGQGGHHFQAILKGPPAHVYEWQVTTNGADWHSALALGSQSSFENLMGDTVVTFTTQPFAPALYGGFLRLVAINGAGVFESPAFPIVKVAPLAPESWVEQAARTRPGGGLAWEAVLKVVGQEVELLTRVSPEPRLNQFVFHWRMEAVAGAATLEMWLDNQVVRTYAVGSGWREERVMIPPGFTQRVRWVLRAGSSGSPVEELGRAQVEVVGFHASAFRIERFAGNGRILLEPDQAEYEPGTTVEARAEPAAGYEFVGWRGLGNDTALNPLRFDVREESRLTAQFAPVFESRWLGLGGLEFTRGGELPWHLQSEQARPGRTYALRSDGGGWLETKLNGPGTLSYWQRFAGDGALLLDRNGTPAGGAGAPGDWSQAVFVVPPGEHVLRWTYQNHHQGVGYLDEFEFFPGLTEPRTLHIDAGGGQVLSTPARSVYNTGERVVLTAMAEPGREFTGWSGDAVGFENPLAIDLVSNRRIKASFAPEFRGELVGTPGLTFRRGGAGLWALNQTSVPPVGEWALRSPEAGAASASWVETVVNGPGTLTFWWKGSSEEDREFLGVWLNFGLVSRISGETEWKQATLEIADGAQLVRWEYRKDSGVHAGLDAGFLGGIEYVSKGFAGWPILQSLPENRRGAEDRNGVLEWPNLLAYALGVDPLTATEADLPRIVGWDVQAGTLTMSYRRSKSARGVGLMLVGAGRLGEDSWSVLESVSEERVDQGDYEWVQQTVAMPATGERYIRLKAWIP